MIKNAQIHFNDVGTPVADDFDDVYFSNDDGLAESHYVFYQQNNIETRLSAHPRPHFTIAETGFGTGLNFLNTWQQWQQLSGKKPKLHFISFEKFPIAPAELAKALKAWPTLSALSVQLCDQYPMALQGCHRIEFEQGQVVLDLWFGDVHDSIPAMSYSQSGLVDAWYLDGFAPSKNPDMWSQPLFNAMANLSQDNATFATFTAAGFVRRGLQSAGFECKKVKGYGRKREMVVGTLPKANAHSNTPKYYALPTRQLEKVAIIGGGISSSTLLYHLAKRGIEAELFCQDDALAKGASHNRQGAVYPNLQADFSPSSEFYAHSFLYATRLFKQLANQGYKFKHDWCGVMLQAVNEGKVQQQENLVNKQNWPNELIKALTAEQSSEIAGVSLPYSSLFIEQGSWVNPAELTQAVFDAANDLTPITRHFDTDITNLSKEGDSWYLHTDEAIFGPYSDVFVCGGEHSDRFEQTQSINLHGVRGQVSHVEAGKESNKLNTVLCHKGYFTPSDNGEHCMGATFDKNTKSRAVKPEDNVTNRKQLMGFYEDADFAQSLGDINSAKAAVRCCFNDHLPMLGQVPEQDDLVIAYANLKQGKHFGFEAPQLPYEGLHIVTGFGARGLCSAPLATEHLVANLCGEPSPYSERVRHAIHPNRFIVRDLIRNKL